MYAERPARRLVSRYRPRFSSLSRSLIVKIEKMLFANPAFTKLKDRLLGRPIAFLRWTTRRFRASTLKNSTFIPDYKCPELGFSGLFIRCPLLSQPSLIRQSADNSAPLFERWVTEDGKLDSGESRANANANSRTRSRCVSSDRL